MFNRKFVTDLGERAIKTFAQALAATLGANAITLSDVDWGYALGVAGLAAIISVLTSIASYRIGEEGTASLVGEENR